MRLGGQPKINDNMCLDMRSNAATTAADPHMLLLLGLLLLPCQVSPVVVWLVTVASVTPS